MILLTIKNVFLKFIKKHTVTELNSAFDVVINRLDTAGDRMSKFEERSKEPSILNCKGKS